MKRHKRPQKFSRSGGQGRGSRGPGGDADLIYGLHAAEAALTNPRRHIRQVLLTRNAAERLGPVLASRGISPETAAPEILNRRLGSDTVHQGVLVEADPLPAPSLDDVAADQDRGPLVVLDQVTDPHNVGAILRSAAAFGAAGLVMTDRHSPPLTGALAKAASGAIELVPVVRVPNLARALGEIADAGWQRVGLDSEAETPLESTSLSSHVALVLGAEDRGLRRLTREHCDLLCRLGTRTALASLNVSNAAAIALHWVGRDKS
ncbi:MAG: 23S rRNA (guanosine(2251)-2'-O)-methyltransferase RlmB [Hyphomicrobiales bacterium]